MDIILEFFTSNINKLLKADFALLAFAVVIAVIIVYSIRYLILKRRELSSNNILLATLSFLFGWLIIGTIVPEPLSNIKLGPEPWPPKGGILAAVKERGYLRCGVNDNLPGFSEIRGREASSKKIYYDDAQGFDADFCRVIAAAIFGDHRGKVKFLPLTAYDPDIEWRDRFQALTQGHIDLLVRNTSATAGREFGLSFTFGPTIFYDRQVFITKKEKAISRIEDIKAQDSICVTAGTTTEDNLDAILKGEYDIDYEKITATKGGESFQDNATILGALQIGQCDLMTGDFSLMATIAGPSTGYNLIEASLSKELLSPVSVKEDRAWSDIIKYAIYATIEAAELGIKKRDIEDLVKKKKDLSSYERNFLGLDDGENIGESLGLRADFARNIITQVGNYDDIYANNLLEWKLFQDRGPNQVVGSCDGHLSTNSMSDCGLLISPPFTPPAKPI